mmetsp:Transcript_23859/g.39323  ORF Transcript_23859/g.39323 Transcript_23859/m.39323 type:complete len:80 (-) Transcript_23859:918-1157(-)
MSKPEVLSSSNSIRGFVDKAIARSTRCDSPPERDFHSLSMCSLSDLELAGSLVDVSIPQSSRYAIVDESNVGLSEFVAA